MRFWYDGEAGVVIAVMMMREIGGSFLLRSS